VEQELLTPAGALEFTPDQYFSSPILVLQLDPTFHNFLECLSRQWKETLKKQITSKYRHSS
jgi:hypothetical protein